MTSTKVTDAASAAPAAVSVGKEPRTRPRPRKPRRRRRMLTGVSRQRRAANARERQRIQGVNEAFLTLKDILPVLKPEDVSKTETLHLAAKWIAHLTSVLIQDDRKRKWSPETSSGQCLPLTIQEKLDDLQRFDLEDFMLIAASEISDYEKSDTHKLSTSSLRWSCDGHCPSRHVTGRCGCHYGSTGGSLSGSSDCQDSSDGAESSSDNSDHLRYTSGVVGVVSAGCDVSPAPGRWVRPAVRLPDVSHHDHLMDLTNLTPGAHPGHLPSTHGAGVCYTGSHRPGVPASCLPTTPLSCTPGPSFSTLPPVSTFYR